MEPNLPRLSIGAGPTTNLAMSAAWTSPILVKFDDVCGLCESTSVCHNAQFLALKRLEITFLKIWSFLDSITTLGCALLVANRCLLERCRCVLIGILLYGTQNGMDLGYILTIFISSFNVKIPCHCVRDPLPY